VNSNVNDAVGRAMLGGSAGARDQAVAAIQDYLRTIALEEGVELQLDSGPVFYDNGHHGLIAIVYGFKIYGSDFEQHHADCRELWLARLRAYNDGPGAQYRRMALGRDLAAIGVKYADGHLQKSRMLADLRAIVARLEAELPRATPEPAPSPPTVAGRALLLASMPEYGDA
jgi:hypothetical protein